MTCTTYCFAAVRILGLGRRLERFVNVNVDWVSFVLKVFCFVDQRELPTPDVPEPEAEDELTTSGFVTGGTGGSSISKLSKIKKFN